ncbi:hypothetical protein D3OALGA1CA_3415 [Olavius algarvensis associated proteobacterium Delta 3]|nr:hypothetical protein D3OALGB2SA_765 [Olavius algarvensis associated proteobacterium Delta 3]CAB5133993.1 hypothetical protein D3OALGA1CA_3415 [Olavius algarvensis associated proteobacterium Delta 3]
MPTDRDIRKLAASMHAGVKGYSCVLSEDEPFTIRMRKEPRELFSTIGAVDGGRIVNAPDDSSRAEFSSVISAPRCANEPQKYPSVRNTELPDHRRMDYPIGVSVGDVIQEEDHICDDGVTIAARVESLLRSGRWVPTSSRYRHLQTNVRGVVKGGA